MRSILSSILVALLAAPTLGAPRPIAMADSTGLPGDHFSLQGALEIFKTAKDLESFEKALNAEDNHVNNLDLDGDGNVDYVRVIDHSEGEVHAITFQVPLGKEEAQDVAVIELEKNGDHSAILQIRGAEELYGSDAIVEPFEEKAEEAPQQKGPAPPVDGPRLHVWVNVWAWPCVTWIYGPSYVMWNSPWYWGYYPPWWRPWRPWGWSAWHGWHRPYWGWYRHVNTCRVVHAHTLYQHRATFSPAVRQRTQAARTTREATRGARMEQAQPTRKAPARTGTVRKKDPAPQRTTRPAPSRRDGGGRTAPVKRGR